VCWDNAQQESFWYTLETEFHDRYSFATRAEAIEAVNRWIDTVCNTCRRHSALGQISPLQFETQYTTAAQEAA
jgi:transposase InsO family protein